MKTIIHLSAGATIVSLALVASCVSASAWLVSGLAKSFVRVGRSAFFK